jgi:hypothetical protein
MRFTVSKVPVERHAARVAAHKDQVESLAKSPLEAVSRPPRGREVIRVGRMHQFVGAVGAAFSVHYPLVLSPDSVWLTISQGLAHHINANAEAVRKKFVAHEGKVQIVIRRDSFIKGALDNDWEGAFGEFSSKIQEHIGKSNHEMIVADFSTTGPVERAASEVVLMDAMKSYFEYGMMTMCGIPDIELLGTAGDWERLRDKVNGWTFPGKADLAWWTTPLKRVLDGFVSAAKGKADPEWWESFYKENSGHGSGSVSKISGWINWLFPYVQGSDDKLVKNRKVGVLGLEYGDGLEESDYPSSLAKVPFEWNYYGQIFQMELLAGVTAVVQDRETYAVAPNVGWAVREVGAVNPKKSKINWR